MNLELLAPELSLGATAIAVILLDLFIERKGLLAVLSIVGLTVAAGLTLALWGDAPREAVAGMLSVDNFSLFFKLLFIGIAGLVILASVDYSSKFANFRGEYHALILLATLGMMLMAASTEMVTTYIALELTSISLYVLTGFLKDPKSTESSLKYLLLGAIASAVLLYGMALVFGSTGTTQFAEIAVAIQGLGASGVADNPALVLGIVLIIAGFGFKIAAVPFQMWVPDVYEGAPTPVVAFLSVASKAAGFAIILRIFSSAFGTPEWLSSNWGMIFAVLAAIGMTVGNVTALVQTNVKRMFGYSSIAQAGYLMVGLAALGLASSSSTLAQGTVIFFLLSYAVANLGAFIAIIAITSRTGSDLIEDFSGMGKRAPVLALALTLSLISLIGMPPAAGFMAKFYIFSGALQSDLLWLVIIAVLNSVVSAFYYLRVVKLMWLGEPASEEKLSSSVALRVALGLACLGVLILGIVPGAAMKVAETAASIFGS
ncbi:MAG: NADH-quinone oxidoreductase subunit N [Dehalococcoidales bacterium]